MTTTDTHRQNVEYLASRDMECPVHARIPDVEQAIKGSGLSDFVDINAGRAAFDDCSTCNGTGRVPCFPMLRLRCAHLSGDECLEKGCAGFGVYYSAAPMDALLARIGQIGWNVERETSGTWFVTGIFEDWTVSTRSRCQGTDYERLCDALAQAVKAQEASSGTE